MVPPISTAMKCVITLTVVYFVVYFAISLGRAVSPESVRKRFAAAMEGVEHSLAFAPMLCILMITVRLRAIQLCLRDPQRWVQIAMYVATTAVLLKVATAMCVAGLVKQDDDDDWGPSA